MRDVDEVNAGDRQPTLTTLLEFFKVPLKNFLKEALLLEATKKQPNRTGQMMITIRNDPPEIGFITHFGLEPQVALRIIGIGAVSGSTFIVFDLQANLWFQEYFVDFRCGASKLRDSRLRLSVRHSVIAVYLLLYFCLCWKHLR